MGPGRKSLVINAFRPGTEIEDPALFAGRVPQIKAVAEALHARGSCPVIYGDRGLGKSSLALQAQRIAMGDVTLLAEHGLSDWALTEGELYIAFYVPCSDQTPTTPEVLRRVVNSLSSVTPAETARRATHLVDRTTTKRVTLKVFEADVVKRYAPPTAPPDYSDSDVEEQVIELASRLYDSFGHPILVILDEVDRVHDTSGLASFLKSHTTDFFKVMLVGIAQNVSDLLAQHQSLERSQHPIRVERMEQPDLWTIVRATTAKLSESGIDFDFEPPAVIRIAHMAAGFPWFVHLFGQAALLRADEAGRSNVTIDDVDWAVNDLRENRFAQQFSDDYQRAVRDSVYREYVLRGFASWNDTNIPTADVYRVLKTELGVGNPSVYKGHLCGDQYGRILLTPPFQERGVVRFRNEMFKHYVRLRGSIYEHVDERVREAFGQ